MPLENVEQIIDSNLRVSDKEEDAFNFQPMQQEIRGMKNSRLIRKKFV